MKIKTLTQRGKYTLLAGVLGMTSIPSSAIPTGMTDVSFPTVAQQTAKIKGKVLMPEPENRLSVPMSL